MAGVLLTIQSLSALGSSARADASSASRSHLVKIFRDWTHNMMRFTTIQQATFLTLLLLTSLAFVWLLQDFAQPLFWAAILAILFYPLYCWWFEVLGHRASLAALVTLLVILVMVILPLGLIGLAVTREAAGFFERIAAGEIDVQAPIRFIERTLPVVAEYLDHFGIDRQKITQNLSGAAVTTSRLVASQALTIGQNAFRFSVLFLLMLYLLFFFLRDGHRLIAAIMYALPLGHEREHHLFEKFADVSRATVKGTLVVGVVQGTLGGLFFWILGLNAAVFWGVIMTLLSLLPAVGSALIWGPAAIILLATGKIVKGIILLAAGSLIIGLVDNLLRPMLVGRDTQIPDYLILLATLGGLTVFGLSGFVIGPIIAALFLAVWDMFAQEYGHEDVSQPLPAAASHPDKVTPALSDDESRSAAP
jgi:predicted PurR-regulated permease PerM